MVFSDIISFQKISLSKNVFKSCQLKIQKDLLSFFLFIGDGPLVSTSDDVAPNMLHKSFRFSSSAQNNLIRSGGVAGSGNSSASESEKQIEGTFGINRF